ncbi:MAG: BlaI/MecI/CopY family transcriptional regulator [Tepidisphaerales bacterium]
MAKIPAISDAEWSVMRVVWEATGPVTAGEVVERLAGRHDWSPSTVKTMLGRLVRKGALAYAEDGKRYLYRARVPMEQCLKAESRSFVDRVFGGAAGPMLSYFVRSSNLSAEEIAELKRMLSGKEK